MANSRAATGGFIARSGAPSPQHVLGIRGTGGQLGGTIVSIRGTPPSLINVPAGCPFNPRCDYAARNNGRSETEVPALRPVGPGHLVACHLSTDEQRRIWAERDKVAS